MIKALELVLYVLTSLYAAFILSMNIDYQNFFSIVIPRIPFFIANAGLMWVVLLRCNRLLKKFEHDHYTAAEKLMGAADTSFVMLAIVTAFDVVRLAFGLVFSPQDIFFFGRGNGFFFQIFLTVVALLFSIRVKRKFIQVKKTKSLLEHPPLESNDSFFGFSTAAENEEISNTGAPYDSPQLDDLVPDEEDFRRHLQRLSVTKEPVGLSERVQAQQRNRPYPEPPEENLIPDENDFRRHLQRISEVNAAVTEEKEQQFRECPFCGSVNPMNSKQCSFCGADLD